MLAAEAGFADEAHPSREALRLWADRRGDCPRGGAELPWRARSRGLIRARFVSVTEGFDTTTNGARMVFGIFAVLAEFERGLTRERTMAGLEAARERGHRGARRPVLRPEQARHARQMHADGQNVATIARVLGVSRPSIYRVVQP